MASQRQRLIRELAAIRKVQTERPSWFRRHDDERLAREFASKSAELVALEITAYRKKLSR